jgi:hypothetical protein
VNHRPQRPIVTSYRFALLHYCSNAQQFLKIETLTSRIIYLGKFIDESQLIFHELYDQYDSKAANTRKCIFSVKSSEMLIVLAGIEAAAVVNAVERYVRDNCLLSFRQAKVSSWEKRSISQLKLNQVKH